MGAGHGHHHHHHHHKHQNQHEQHTHNHHHHHRSRDGSSKGLLLALCITSVMFILEIIGFWYSNSLALISDAGHLLSDILALGLSAFAGWMSMKPATRLISYGWHRFEVLAAGTNGGSLLVIAVWIVVEAYNRLQSPPTVQVSWLLPIAVTGLIGNLLSAYILHRTGDVENELNLKSAYWHVIGDALGSVGAIIAAIAIWVWGAYWIDPLISLMIAVIISKSGYSVLKEAVLVLMEATPDRIDVAKMQEELQQIDGVVEVHDLHVWSITSDYLAMTAHVIILDANRSQEILQQAIHIVEEHHGVEHSTIQVETAAVKHSALHN